MTDPDTMAEHFAQWAKREGILPVIDEGQCADLTKAYMAGWAMAEAWQDSGCAAGMEALKRLTAKRAEQAGSLAAAGPDERG